ncbi:unnamed protein product [Timema podura]|uniref:Uncharacterized protein n=1 Tax=Timema podura TaxID=61482 RepID=A0ABN7P7E4_TIMPD|nr:unnamed protein product [Timema podura]
MWSTFVSAAVNCRAPNAIESVIGTAIKGLTGQWRYQTRVEPRTMMATKTTLVVAALLATVSAGLPDPKDVIGDPERIDTWAKCLVEENRCTAEIAPLRVHPTEIRTFDLLVIGSLAQHETSALANYATEACLPDTKIPEALKSEFSNTTPEERTFIRETSKYLMANKPDQWKEIEEYYDRENKYKEKFDQFLEVAR